MRMRGFLFFKILCVLVFFGITSLSCLKTPPFPFKILPKPRQAILLNGEGLRVSELRTIRMEGDFPRPVMGSILSRLPLSDKAERGTLTLILSENNALPQSEEGYILGSMLPGADNRDVSSGISSSCSSSISVIPLKKSSVSK